MQEKVKAKQSIIKQTQQEVGIYNLMKGKKLHIKSKIWILYPFLYNHGVPRVGGKLRKLSISEDMKYPIIIPLDSCLTELLINQAHEVTFHGGVRLTLAYIRRKYWIIGG